MHQNQMLNLLARNAKLGEFRAEATTDGATIWVYDKIVGSELEAELFGGITAGAFIAELKAYAGKPVTIRVNSPGGNFFAAQAMAQAVKEHGAPVTVQVDALAASAATFLLCAASAVAMSSGSLVMIHKAQTIAGGNADDFMHTAGVLEKVDGVISASYAEKSGKHDAAHFLTLMAAETWFNAEEAIEIGLADSEAGEKITNATAWDLTAFEHAPEPEAKEEFTVRNAAVTISANGTVTAIEGDSGTTVEPAPPVTNDNEIEARQRKHRAAMILRPTA